MSSHTSVTPVKSQMRAYPDKCGLTSNIAKFTTQVPDHILGIKTGSHYEFDADRYKKDFGRLTNGQLKWNLGLDDGYLSGVNPKINAEKLTGPKDTYDKHQVFGRLTLPTKFTKESFANCGINK